MEFKPGNIHIIRKEFVPCQHCGKEIERLNMGKRKATCVDCRAKQIRAYYHANKK